MYRYCLIKPSSACTHARGVVHCCWKKASISFVIFLPNMPKLRLPRATTGDQHGHHQAFPMISPHTLHRDIAAAYTGRKSHDWRSIVIRACNLMFFSPSWSFIYDLEMRRRWYTGIAHMTWCRHNSGHAHRPLSRWRYSGSVQITVPVRRHFISKIVPVFLAWMCRGKLSRWMRDERERSSWGRSRSAMRSRVLVTRETLNDEWWHPDQRYHPTIASCTSISGCSHESPLAQPWMHWLRNQ